MSRDHIRRARAEVRWKSLLCDAGNGQVGAGLQISREEVTDTVYGAASQNGGHGVDDEDAESRDEEGAGVDNPHFGEAVPRAHIEKAETHPRGYAGERDHRDVSQRAGTQAHQGEEKGGVHEVRDSRGSTAADISHATCGNADAHRGAEHSCREIRDSIGADFGVRIAALQVFVLSLKVLNRAGGKKDVDGYDEGQRQTVWQNSGDILTFPL